MTSRIVRIALICALALAVPTWGQDASPSPKPAEKKTVKTMIDYKEDLSMTDEQVKEVKDALASYAATLKQQRGNLQTLEKEYRVLLKEEAPLADIKKKLVEIMQVRFNLRYADVLTTRRVTKALSEDQMKQWKEIQAKARAKK